MLEAIVQLAFDQLDVKKLMATAALGNPASLRVLTKQGFQVVGEKELPTVKGTVLRCHLLTLESDQ